MKKNDDLMGILSVISIELLDPQWGQGHNDAINPCDEVSPRIVADKIARTLQSIVSGNLAIRQNSPASGL